MRTENLIALSNQELDTRRGNVELINAYYEATKDGQFKRLRRTEGLTQRYEVGTGPIRGLWLATPYG